MEINVIPESFESKRDKFPFPSPFVLSSVEKDWCRYDAVKIVFLKRRHLEENLKTIAGELGMREGEFKKFIDYWCSPRGQEIRAEADPFFNLRQRAESWMEKTKPTQKTQKSRLEQYAESARQALGTAQSVPPGNPQPAGPGYTVLPDEQ